MIYDTAAICCFKHCSWDEHSQFDLPAMLSYVLNHTKQEKIFYIGHSMGTTAFMAMANMRPGLQKHILLANFLAPVAFVGHMRSSIRDFAPLANPFEVRAIYGF